MKTIKTTTTVALMAFAPLAAQAAMPVPAPVNAPATTRDAGVATPVFLDLRQLERDLVLLLDGNGGNSRDNSRDGNSDDRNGGDSNGGNSNGGNSGGNGGNSGGGNGGNS